LSILGEVRVDDASTCTASPEANELWTRQRWSEADWDALDHDTSRVELVDGMVRRRAYPDSAHQQVKAALRAILARLAPTGFAVATDIEVRLAEIHRRRPDIVVVAATALDDERWHVDPEEVLLAIEIVGPGSETTDRKHKPIEYADADIGHYWRVETRPALTVHTYRLGESSHYLETGIFRRGDRVSDPTLRWAEFDLDQLAGR
jgi:Uma2 family endonuclease